MRLRLPIALLVFGVAIASPALAAPPNPSPPKSPGKAEPPKGGGTKGPSRVDIPTMGSKDPSKDAPAEDARTTAAKALAKQAEARMAEQIKRGREACERGDFEEGIGVLSAAWSQKSDADVAASLGACEAQAGRFPSAAEHLAAALRVKEDSPERKKLEEMFVDARKRVGGVKVTVNVEGADVIVGDRLVGQSPLPGEVYVEPGKAVVIVAKKPGYEEVDRRVQVPAKSTIEISFELSQSSNSGNRYAGASRSRVPMLVLGGAALVAGGVGASFYAAGLSKASAADALLAEIKTASSAKYACSPSQAGCATLKDLRASRDTLMNTGTGVLIGGGVLLGAAVLTAAWAFSGSSSTAAAPSSVRFASITVTPAVSTEGGGLFLRGAF